MLTYEQSAELMNDLPLRNRIKVACLKYANSLMDSRGPVPGGNALQNWARATFQSPDNAAQQVQPIVVMDQQLQEYGGDINDNNLQTVVEYVVNKTV